MHDSAKRCPLASSNWSGLLIVPFKD